MQHVALWGRDGVGGTNMLPCGGREGWEGPACCPVPLSLQHLKSVVDTYCKPVQSCGVPREEVCVCVCVCVHV